MKKEMILPSSSVRSGQYAASRPSVFAALKGYCLRSKAVHSLSAFYSRLLETLYVYEFSESPFLTDVRLPDESYA